MWAVSRELIILLLQFLDEENFKETMHMLEIESGLFFNMNYFEDMVTDGKWEDVEKYLSAFTKMEDNRYSVKIYFEIRKQKYLEALDRKDNVKAVDILKKDLKEFSRFNEDLFKEVTLLITLNDIRENEQLSSYVDTKSARAIMLVELKKLIEANPLFRDKLQFPSFMNSRLRTLINQSLNWQHQLCKNPNPNPDIQTLFVDHTCGQPNGPRAPSPVINQLMGGGMPYTEPSQIRSLKLPDNLPSTRIVRVMYTNLGGTILALASNAVHKVWRWQKSDRNTNAKATTRVAPVLWQPSSGTQMINDISETNPENIVPCFAISKNDSYIMSASGGKINVFNLITFKTMTSFLPPPPAATSLAFHPLDNNVIAIGMEDFSVLIYNARHDEIKTKLIGHQKRVTGLAFSTALKILISTGADAQLFVWSSETWERQTCKYFLVPSGRGSNPLAQTQVQFHQDQKQLMVVHETQVAIYEAPDLKCIMKWVVEEGNLITDATYSCDSQLIFASFRDGSVGIFTSPALQLRCKISPMAYLPSTLSSSVYPLAIAANPIAQSQLALGLSDGSIFILEPAEEAEGRWGLVPPHENGVGPSTGGATVNRKGAAGPL